MLFTNNRAGKVVLATAFAGAMVFSGMGTANAFPNMGNGPLPRALSGVETDVSYEVDIEGKHVRFGTFDEYKEATKDNVRVSKKQRMTITYTFHENFGRVVKGPDGNGTGKNIVQRRDKVWGGLDLDLKFLKDHAKDLSYDIKFGCDTVIGGCGGNYTKYINALYASPMFYGKKDMTGTDVDRIEDIITLVTTQPLRTRPATRSDDVDPVTVTGGVRIPLGFTITVGINFTAAKAGEGTLNSDFGVCLDKADFGVSTADTDADGSNPDGVCDRTIGNDVDIPISFDAPFIEGDKYGPVCRPGTEIFDAVNHEEELALWVKETYKEKVKVGNFKFFDNKDRGYGTLQEALKAMTDNGYVTDKTEVVKMKMEYTAEDGAKSGKKTFRLGLRAADSELCKKPKEPVIPAPVQTTIIQKIDVPKKDQQPGQKTIQGG